LNTVEQQWQLKAKRLALTIDIYLHVFLFNFLEMRQRKLAAYQQQQQMNYQMNAMQAMQNPYFRMQFMPPSMQSMMFMQMRAPAVATNQRAQLQAMFNSMPPETRQAFMMNMKSGGSMASMYGQPSMSGEWAFTFWPC
jgi:hypothetical protein